MRPDVWEEVLNRLRQGDSVEIISDWLGGILPSAGGAMTTFGRAVGPTGGLTAPANFAGASANSFTPMARNIDTVNPVPSQSQRLRQDIDPGSPWDDTHPDAMSWATGAPQQARIGSWVETISQGQPAEGPRYRGLDQILAPEFPEMKVSASDWTNVSVDTYLVQHLLALYFCWEYPTFASLSKEHFLKDFQDGQQRYCSSILINALLALGCRFSSQPNTRANPDDPYTSGDHFFEECQRLLYQERNHHTLTTIQALGIMSIREASCGRDSESWYYAGQSIRLAIEMGLHQLNAPTDGDNEDELAVKSATFWGAFALDQ